jgi:predicted metal-dependent phosphoesterase TrpH
VSLKLIDLHTHTTASDGTCSPDELVALAAEVGIGVLGVADHDTMDAVSAVSAAARKRGIEVIPGIEVTAVANGKDVHVLGYFADPEDRDLLALLTATRKARLGRAQRIGDLLAEAGVPIDVQALLNSARANDGKALARPQIARALVAAGHVASVSEAFDRFLGESCVAYVPHTGASPAEVVEVVTRAGGVTSLAHPGTLNRDELIPSMVDAGLTAIEVYHSAHTPDQVQHYLQMANDLGLAITGGSDFHGPGARRSEFFGQITLPVADFQRFQALGSSRNVHTHPLVERGGAII